MRSLLSNKRFLLILALVVVLAGTGGGWYYYNQYLPAQAAPPVETIETAQVYRGDLVITASGTGELVPSREVESGFSTSGTLVEMLVEVGDRVQAGDVLARLDVAPLERAVIQAEANLIKAQNNLEKAQNPYADLDLTQARLAVAQAELDLAEAEEKLEEARNPYTDLDLTQARLDVAQAQVALEEAEEKLEEVRNPASELDLTEARLAVDQARTKLEEAKENLASVKAGPTETELASAEAVVAKAQDDYEGLLAGPDTEAVERAKLQLDQARNSLWSSQLSRDSTCGAAARGAASKSSCDTANIQVLNGEISVRLAEISYQQAQESATAAEIADAAAQVEQAKEKLEELRNSPTSLDVAEVEAQVTQAEFNLAKAQEALADIEAGADPLELSQAEAEVAQAEHNLSRLQETLAEIEAGSDPAEVSRAEAQVAQAEYNLAKAQEALAEIEAGPDPDEVKVAEADLINAQASLEEAQAELEAATLVAPFSGTVISVGASAGDTVSSSTAVVTLADLEIPQVLFWVEETDLASVAPGNAVNFVFEALPDYTFPGEIVSVDPSLVTVSNTPAIQVRASIDLSAHPVNLLSGMNADVEIVAGEARNALLVPIQALREIAPDQYAVFVVQPNEELELRMVEVGLKDYVNAEILSGLEVGESVSTGTVESSDTSTGSSTGGEQQPMPGMMRFFGGG